MPAPVALRASHVPPGTVDCARCTGFHVQNLADMVPPRPAERTSEHGERRAVDLERQVILFIWRAPELGVSAAQRLGAATLPPWILLSRAGMWSCTRYQQIPRPVKIGMNTSISICNRAHLHSSCWRRCMHEGQIQISPRLKRCAPRTTEGLSQASESQRRCLPCNVRQLG